MSTIKTTDVQPNQNGHYECPECAGTEHPMAFPDRGHLGLHRRSHGIFGVSKAAIDNRNRRARLGPPRPHPSTLALQPAKVAQIVTLHGQGFSAPKIAAQVGTSVSTVYKYTKGGSSKVGRPKGSKNRPVVYLGGPKRHKLNHPIVERGPEPPATLIERVRDLEAKIREIEKAIGL